MKKIVINACYGGFGLSEEALKSFPEGTYGRRDIPRDDPRLIEVVERLGDDASGKFGKLKVVEIPDDVDWIIEEYDGFEHVAEAHRTWS